ncbi:MAG: hypothetical protein ACMXX7_01165 [Candidatus Woesearchaeota archaeon]
MFVDVALPKGNEKEFVEIAKKLGTEALLFLYDKKIGDFETKEIKIYKGLINSKNQQKITFNIGERFSVEQKHQKYLYGFETLERKDSMHQRRSGMNQVIAKLIKQKEKTYIIDFEKFIERQDKETILGRLNQNLMLARKYELDVAICSFATKPENLRPQMELKSLISSFGFQQIAKKSVTTLHEKLEEKE